ncbi:MAG: hypothetical protein Q4Q08_09890 [Eubacteriales bacterium]|nr:hypothetical protein [Eubacteriales bacterium]
MKYRAAFALALSTLMLTACAAEPAASTTSAAESAAPAVSAQEPPAASTASSKPLYILNSGGTAKSFSMTDTTAYLPAKFGDTLLATKIDFATAQQQVLCSIDGCTHADASCPAFMAANDDALSQYYTGGLVAAGDRLYWFINGGASPVNVRVDVSALDGSDRRTIVEHGSEFQLDCTTSMYFTDGDSLYLATAAGGLVRLDDTGLTSVFPLNDGHPTPENPLYTQDSTPRCTILGCWQDMAVFACTPSLSGSGNGLIGVHADGSVTDLGSYSTDFISFSTLHDGKIYHVPGSGNQAETIEVTDLAAQTTETLPLPAGGGWNNYCVAYGDGIIGLIRNGINYAWTPGSDTAVELAPTWCKDTAVARSPVIYAENGTIALIKVSDRTISTPQLTPEGIPYQRQQTFSDLALISLQDLFSGSQDWMPVTMLDDALLY